MSHCLDNLSIYQSPSLTALLVEPGAPKGVQTPANGASMIFRPERIENEMHGEIYGLLFINVDQTFACRKFVIETLNLDFAALALRDMK